MALTKNFQQPLMAVAANSTIITELTALTVNYMVNGTVLNGLLQL